MDSNSRFVLVATGLVAPVSATRTNRELIHSMDLKSNVTTDQLEKIVLHTVSALPKTRAEFEDAKRVICSKLGIGQPPNRFLRETYQRLVAEGTVPQNSLADFFLRKATIRSMSGIAVVTSLIKPYMCPGKCVYCPTEARMPKSYIATEPAAARALRLNFSPYEQMRQRIEMLACNGHNTDKIEYILKGGTWNAYPLSYQYWFILESFKACNNLKRKQNNEPEIPATYEDDWKGKNLEELQQALEAEQLYNETANHRIIGLTLETRPDAISPKTICHMRRQGCTRVELGLQAADDKILELIKRGHTVDEFRRAIWLLREAGFKVDLHFMPDLPGTTADHDVEMYRSLFTDPALKPDMVKIYPCTVIKSAELYGWLQDGRYTPYGPKALFAALLEMKKSTPRYCRISRLIRDIPANEIEAGNTITNLREELSAELTKRGEKCVCLRCREIGRQKENVDMNVEPLLFVDEYETLGGREYFITFEDKNRIAVYGFLRLRIPAYETQISENILTQEKKEFMLNELHTLLPDTKDVAFIRELHVYDTLVGIGDHDSASSQHKGFGKRLLEKAEQIARENAYTKCAVISGVGVRGYYEKNGYRKIDTYMVKEL